MCVCVCVCVCYVLMKKENKETNLKRDELVGV